MSGGNALRSKLKIALCKNISLGINRNSVMVGEFQSWTTKRVQANGAAILGGNNQAFLV